MSEPLQSRLRRELQLAVQSIQWTYSLFWQFCPQQERLVWSDGYYNGSIKTRKTVQPMELTTEEATVHRSEQLRELYDSLAAGEANPKPRPVSALSPEDLTESEWFYLISISFSFPLGEGLPGKAYSHRRHVWLTGAGEVSSRVFSRSLLAKSARMQTVVYLPVPDGVIELGTTQRVEQDVELLKRITSFFLACQNLSHPRQALSEHSTSDKPGPTLWLPVWQIKKEDDEDEDEDGEAEQEYTLTRNSFDATGEQSVTMQEDIWQGSPLHTESDDINFHESPTLGFQSSYDDVLSQEDAHYTQQLSFILKNQNHRRSSKSMRFTALPSTASAFSKWFSHRRHGVLHDQPSQLALKYVLCTAPHLYKSRDSSACRSMLAERRRREKLNERFLTLQSIVPIATKMDKASILGSTIEYVKQLRRRIQELETSNSDMNTRLKGHTNGKRRMSIAEGGGGRKPGSPEPPRMAVATTVDVSIIENDGLVEIKCLNRGELLLDLMHLLTGLGIEVQTVQCSVCNGVISASFRAKVKENVNGRNASIMEVKKSIYRIIDSSPSS